MRRVWLRYSAQARSTMMLRMAIPFLLPLGALILARGASLPVALAVTFGLALLVDLVLANRMRTKFYVRGDNLMRRGRSAPVCSLLEVNADVVRVRGPRDQEEVLLRLDDLRIRVGDSGIACYYEPADLLAIADGLARSGYTQPLDVANQLRQMAADPTRRAWPPDSRPMWT